MAAGAGERGRLVVVEGPEGAGKTTQLARLAEWMANRGQRPHLVREPGTSEVGRQIRRLVLDPQYDVAARTEALLFMAARAELVATELRPRLDAGQTIFADRFFLSTYAYQIHGRGLPEADIVAANRFATQELVPDLTLLLQLPPATGLERARRRSSHDRMEQAGAGFHDRVAAAFASFAEPGWQAAHPECGPIVAIAAEGSEDDVFAALVEALAARWPATFGEPAPATGPRP
ncbi:MAG: dTMP kinase [Gemmatimonadaceae bacterium]